LRTDLLMADRIGKLTRRQLAEHYLTEQNEARTA
jgi:hypothetical protein